MFETECINNCGMTMERKEMNHRVRKDCKEAIVQCPFQQARTWMYNVQLVI